MQDVGGDQRNSVFSGYSYCFILEWPKKKLEHSVLFVIFLIATIEFNWKSTFGTTP